MHADFISSRKNETLREAAKLLVSEKMQQKGLFLAEGARLCRDAVRSGITVKELFYTQSAGEGYPEHVMELREKAEKVFCFSAVITFPFRGQKIPGNFTTYVGPVIEKKEIPYNHCLALENVPGSGKFEETHISAAKLWEWAVCLRSVL